MVGAAKGILHIADHRIEPLEHLAVIIPAVLIGDDRLMAAWDLGDSSETVEAIADYMTARTDNPGAPGSDFLASESSKLGFGISFCQPGTDFQNRRK
jgi:hypothetical protein